LSTKRFLTPCTQGKLIAFVGPNCASDQMLLFEMFADVRRRDSLSTGPGTKYLYVPQRDYWRRSDLLDPTPFLDRWAAELRQEQLDGQRLQRLGEDAMKQFHRLTGKAPVAPQPWQDI
jgi:hypothetical protein